MEKDSSTVRLAWLALLKSCVIHNLIEIVTPAKRKLLQAWWPEKPNDPKSRILKKVFSRKTSWKSFDSTIINTKDVIDTQFTILNIYQTFPRQNCDKSYPTKKTHIFVELAVLKVPILVKKTCEKASESSCFVRLLIIQNYDTCSKKIRKCIILLEKVDTTSCIWN